MNRDRIAELLEPFLTAPIGSSDASARLSFLQLDNISTYIDILLRWNSRVNLTAIRHPEEIVTRHFGESLFAARVLFPAGTAAEDSPAKGSSPVPGTLADLGSGAGFPGLPIKLWAPHISLTLIESNHKKATFLREVTRALILTDVNIQNMRAQTLAGSPFQVVTLRAVERFESVLPVAASLVGSSGHLALQVGAGQEPLAHQILPHFAWQEPVPIPSSSSRILLRARRP